MSLEHSVEARAALPVLNCAKYPVLSYLTVDSFFFVQEDSFGHEESIPGMIDFALRILCTVFGGCDTTRVRAMTCVLRMT